MYCRSILVDMIVSSFSFRATSTSPYVTTTTAAAFYKLFGEEDAISFSKAPTTNFLSSVSSPSAVKTASSHLMAFQSTGSSVTSPQQQSNSVPSVSPSRPRILLTNRGRSPAFQRTASSANATTLTFLKREDFNPHFDDPLLSSTVLPAPPPIHNKANRKQNLFPPTSSIPPTALSSGKSTVDDEDNDEVGSIVGMKEGEDDDDRDREPCEDGDDFICDLPTSNSSSTVPAGSVISGAARRGRCRPASKRGGTANPSSASHKRSPYFTRSSVATSAVNRRHRRQRRQLQSRRGRGTLASGCQRGMTRSRHHYQPIMRRRVL